MGARKLNNKFLFLLFLLFPAILNGQIKNKFDIHFKYNIGLPVGTTNDYLDMEYGYISPTIMGNVETFASFEAGLLYSGLSFFFQPSLNIGFTDFSANHQLLGKFNNLHLKNLSLSIGGKFNLVNYSKVSHIPYFILNLGYRFSGFSNDETHYNVVAEQCGGDVKNYFELEIQANSRSFYNPFLETGLGLEKKLSSRTYFVLEANITFINYPIMDTHYPALSEEFYLSFGFRYKLLKNKRFYYE